MIIDRARPGLFCPTQASKLPGLTRRLRIERAFAHYTITGHCYATATLRLGTCARLYLSISCLRM